MMLLALLYALSDLQHAATGVMLDSCSIDVHFNHC